MGRIQINSQFILVQFWISSSCWKLFSENHFWTVFKRLSDDRLNSVTSPMNSAKLTVQKLCSKVTSRKFLGNPGKTVTIRAHSANTRISKFHVWIMTALFEEGPGNRISRLVMSRWWAGWWWSERCSRRRREPYNEPDESCSLGITSPGIRSLDALESELRIVVSNERRRREFQKWGILTKDSWGARLRSHANFALRSDLKAAARMYRPRCRKCMCALDERILSSFWRLLPANLQNWVSNHW